jgi:beta-glucosidase-like glycosyl hydrolase
MATKTYAQVISDADVMTRGIREHQDVLANRQIDVVFADAIKASVDLCVSLNGEQEALKARLKEKTEQLDKAMAVLEKKTGEARKIIKLDIPKSLWKEFGITDKR